VQRVRAAADRARCADNLRQIGLALHHYHGAYRVLPPGVRSTKDSEPFPFLAWNARLLPYLEQEALWNVTVAAFAQNPDFRNNPPHVGFGTALPIFNCPSDNRALLEFPSWTEVASTSYLGVEGANQSTKDGVLYLDSKIRFSDIIDGTSNTLMVGERPPSADGIYGWWYGGWGQSQDGSADMVLGTNEKNVTEPGCPLGPYVFGPGNIKNQCDTFHFWSLHPGGANFLMGDGSVHFLTYNAADILPALATRNGREVVSLPD
jgi:prepilin-type processing-associated H-X9-DG protein